MKTKSEVFAETASMLNKHGLRVVKQDDSRPWGGFYVIDESQAAEFAQHFFPFFLYEHRFL